MIYDSKIIAIDINFFENSTNGLDVENDVKKILQRISGDQNLVIMTNENLSDAIQKIKQLNVRSGYIIANAGATIYNIGSEQTLYTMQFHEDIAKAIAHIATLHDLIVIINDRNGGKISYKLNKWIEKHFDNSHINGYCSDIVFYDEWQEFFNKLQTFEINSIEIFFPFNKKDIIEQNKIEFLSKVKSIVNADIFSNENWMFITPKNATRLCALNKICKLINLDIKKNSLYIGVNSFYEKLVKYTYLSITSREVFYQWIDKNMSHNEPNLFLRNITIWSTWLTNNDYLWSNKPVNPIVNFLNTKQFNFSQKEIEQFEKSTLKIIPFKKQNRKDTSAKQNFITKLIKSKDTGSLDYSRDINTDDDAIPVWQENKKELIDEFLAAYNNK